MNAATSGIEKVINEVEKFGRYNSESTLSHFQFTFDDGGESSVDVIPWGGYLFVQATGRSGKIKHAKSALVGYYPPKEFSKALIFDNQEHQLILTGNVNITGDVVVGNRGVTIGTLRNYQTPRRIPIEGNITRLSSSGAYYFNISDYSKSIQKTERLIQEQNSEVFVSGNLLTLENIPENQNIININGNCTISGVLKRAKGIVLIKSDGNITITNGTDINGFVLFKAKGKIVVEGNTRLNNVIVISEDSIAIKSNASIAGQIFAPKISIESQVRVTYPSIVCLTPSKKNGALLVQTGAIIEGTVLISTQTKTSQISFESGSSVYGALYSETNIDFNTSLFGTLITKDFQFYDAPTQYYGWMRSGEINRKKLPDGYMIPFGFSTASHLGILDWQ